MPTSKCASDAWNCACRAGDRPDLSPGHAGAGQGLHLAVFATALLVYALVQIPSSITAGKLIDRFGSRPVLVCYALPMALGSLVLTAVGNWWAVWIFMGGTGIISAANTYCGRRW